MQSSSSTLAVSLALTFCCLVNLTNATPFANRSSESEMRAVAEVFRADFSKSSLSAAFGGAGIKYGGHNAILWGSGGGIDVVYPAGSYSPEGSITGGFGVYTRTKANSDTAYFQYSVFFPEDFNFVLGGKLPGMWGGKESCAGGDPANDCFSMRIMWRDNGKGEAYLYANRPAQDPAICQDPQNYCNPDFGWALKTGAWTFKRGVWTHVDLTVKLNTLGQRNGHLIVKIDGREVIKFTNIVYRVPQYPNVGIDGMAVDTFFGGGSPPWATPRRQITKFRDLVLYRLV